jgi:hypothetical protein
MDLASVVWASEGGSGPSVHLPLDFSSMRLLLSKDVRDENEHGRRLSMSSCSDLVRSADHGFAPNPDLAPGGLS